MNFRLLTTALFTIIFAIPACGDDSGSTGGAGGIGGSAGNGGSGGSALEFPIIEGVLRTPDEAFENLAGYDFAPNYVELGNVRMHYIDEGPRDGIPVVMLHGEPSWSYLYRDIVPAITAAGHRAIVPDLIGFGKSDKPPSEFDHTYDRHVLWTLGLLQSLGLTDIVLVIHDWGGPIGLRLAAENPDLVRLIVVTNTFLPVNEGPTVGAVPMLVRAAVESGPVSGVVQLGTLTSLSEDQLAAYDAPYPDDTFKGGPLAVPRIILEISERPVPPEVQAAWDVLTEWTKPVLTAHSDMDPALGNFDVVFQDLIPGTDGQPHVDIMNGNHFVQEDNAADLSQTIVDFIAANSP